MIVSSDPGDLRAIASAAGAQVEIAHP
jgi:hypothetical protein